MMNRKKKILKHIRKDGIGLEIGPSHSPVAPKAEGYTVHTMDHADKAALIEKFRSQGVAVDRIEDVDFIWRGESYAQLTGGTGLYDWIIASHVIEHTPDLILFLNDCAEILKENGVLSLAVPDSRFCFDCFRPLTGISKILDAHSHKARTHSLGTAVEHRFNYCTCNKRPTWRYGKFRRNFELLHTVNEVQSVMNSYTSADVYSDYHAWCFTPHSFRLLIHDLNVLGLITLKEVSFYPERGCEFFITLGKNGQGPDIPRINLLKKIRDELRVDTSFLELLKLKIRYYASKLG